MLNTGTKCLGAAFIFNAIPKLDYPGVLFHELRVEGSRCFDVVNRLLFKLYYTTFTLWRGYHFPFAHCCTKMLIPILSQLRLTQAGIRVSVISDGFSAVGINFLTILCFICGQAIDLQLLLVRGCLAKAQAQQAQIDLR